MAENWEKKVTDFLKRTGDELKRTGDELRKEGERLITEIRDPATQAKVKDSLANFGTWAKKTAEEAGEIAQVAMAKAQETFVKGGAKPSASSTDTTAAPATPTPAAKPASKPIPKPVAKVASKPAAKAAPVQKTMGRKPGAAKGTSKPPTRVTKTVGRKQK